MATEKSNGTNNSTTAEAPAGQAERKPFRPPQPKPGLRVTPPSGLRRMRRSVGGTVAYLASWWRY